MGIIYHQETKEFHLFNKEISYVMQVLRNGQMGQLYFGKRVPEMRSYGYLIERSRRPMISEIYENEYGYSLENLRQEYPSYGTTDYRMPAVEIAQENGSRITGNDDLRAAIQAAGSDPCTVVYERDGVQAVTNLTPVADLSDGNFRAGVWVRDSSAGVGTLTFVDNTTGMFGGLGHSISDTDTGESIVLRSGEIVPVEIIGYEPGQVGDPGQLKGRFASQIAVGTVLGNDATGVYGTVRTLLGGQDMTVAQSQEVEEGPAQILTTIEGTEPQLYEVEIEQVTLSRQDPNRNLVLRVTDPDLLATTGGIVQGMSGSPIIQNGRLVGAVTHVLVNDPTRGYGIFAENMLETADGLAKEQDAAA